MKKFIIQAVLLIAVTAVAILFFSQKATAPQLPFLPQNPTLKQVQINDVKFNVEVADTQTKRNKGLGGRESLATDAGMLFIFPKTDIYPFWMKGLSFPLDFIWIREGTVVDFTKGAQPPVAGQVEASLPIYTPKEEVDQVLEVNGGTIDRLNIKIGDTVKTI